MKAEVLKNIVLSIIVTVILLTGTEVFFRMSGFTLNNPVPRMIFSNEYAPYLGFINSSNRNGPYSVPNQLTGKLMEGQRSTNNWGYRADINYDFVKYYEKKNNEKIVLLTGGSAAAGAGASDDTKTIDARMQHYLNTLQNKHSYRVFNFANGGWVAMQELIGVQLFGKQLDPDWIVTMNGRNDIAVCADRHEGLAAPMHHAVIDSYIYGYLEQGGGTSFYRGEFENFIIRHSAAYRGLTGKSYIPMRQYIINQHGLRTVGTKVSWKDVEGQIDFYVRAQESFLGISDKCKYIFSLQPLVFGYTTTFKTMMLDELKRNANGDSENIFAQGRSVKRILKQIKKWIQWLLNDRSPDYSFALKYFYREAQRKLKDLVRAHEGRVGVEYVYGGIVFEDRFDDGTHFLDEVHMTDAGEDKVAKLYALMILRRDFPERKPEFDALLRDVIAVKAYASI